MDPWKNPILHSTAIRSKKPNNTMQVGGKTNTVLRLDSLGPCFHFPSSSGVKRNFGLMEGSLCLGLGHPSSSSDSKGSSFSAVSSGEESSREVELDFTLHIGSHDKAPTLPKKVKEIDLELSLATGFSESEITEPDSPKIRAQKEKLPVVGNAYEALQLSNGAPSLSSQSVESSFFLSETQERTFQDLSSMTATNSSVTWTSGITKKPQQRHRSSSSSSNSNSAKTCQVQGCGKGARGATGRCISHGGGRRCQRLECSKGAEGRTPYCKAHGGGRRCEFLGCTKSAEGKTDFCIAHGGGRRCSHDGCSKAARGKSGLCIRHGGGKRCQWENCTRSAEGLSGLCISHGGGRRCQFLGCTKGAQGSTLFCKAHGGGKRCTYTGCSKGAEGSTAFCKGHGGGKRCMFGGGNVCTKSVHGGTDFCVAHGGGKRCAVAECTRSARGRTDFCVRHGGGKRCHAPGCGKSAQGSTDFCKAHGGGKRCLWGHHGSGHGDKGAAPCNSFARGKTGLCTHHSGLGNEKRVHGATVVGPIIQLPNINRPDKTDISEDVPISFGFGFPGSQEVLVPCASISVASEGRVHGGSFMAMFVGGNEGVVLDPPEPDKSGTM